MSENWSTNAEPKPDLIRADWFPIRLEPIQFSGERITIGVGLITKDKETCKVVSTLPHDITKCLFGKRYASLMELAEHALKQVRNHVETKKTIEGFEFDMHGIEIGDVTPIKEYSILNMVNTITRISSCLGAIEPQAEMASAAQPKWEDSIKEIISHTRPQLGKNFNRPLMLRNRKIATIGYVGNKFAANFHEIRRASSIEYHIDKSIRKVIEMRTFINHLSEKKHDFNWAGLIIHCPEFTQREQSKVSKKLDALIYHAQDQNLKVQTVTDAEAAAEMILADAG